jgi:hypothetical protein
MRFSWGIAAGGYGWANAAVEDDELLLTPIGDWLVREYEPLEEFPGLFRTFAETPTTRDGVLAFANQFGHLRSGAECVGGGLDDECEWWENEEWQQVDQATKNEPYLDPYLFWVRQIEWMRECVATWDRAQSGANVSEQAMRRLEETVLNQLRVRVKLAFARDRRVAGFVLQIVPVNLVGSLWLQLAEAISGSKKHRACEACGIWFELSPEKNRTSRHYCSEHCRSRAYRSRKEQARKMAGEGKTVAKIAAALGSDAKTIKGWLKERG